MVAGSIAEDIALAVPAGMLWKAAFSHDASTLQKAFAGMVDAVEINGDGGPGSIITMKFNPAVGAATVLKSRLVSRDHAARVISWDEVVVEGGEVDAALLRSQVIQVKVVPAGEDACVASGGGRNLNLATPLCVAKVTVEYELLGGGAALSAEDKAKLMNGYVALIKKAGENLAAHPGEFAA